MASISPRTNIGDENVDGLIVGLLLDMSIYTRSTTFSIVIIPVIIIIIIIITIYTIIIITIITIVIIISK